MAEQVKTSDLASRLLNRKKKNGSAENGLPVNTKLRSFDRRQEVETAYQDALAKFKMALQTMPEWLAWENARNQWKDLHNLEHARIRNEALEVYTNACNDLPEWQAYYAALKRKYQVVNCGMMS